MGSGIELEQGGAPPSPLTDGLRGGIINLHRLGFQPSLQEAEHFLLQELKKLEAANTRVMTSRTFLEGIDRQLVDVISRAADRTETQTSRSHSHSHSHNHSHSHSNSQAAGVGDPHIVQGYTIGKQSEDMPGVPLGGSMLGRSDRTNQGVGLIGEVFRSSEDAGGLSRGLGSTTWKRGAYLGKPCTRM